MNEQCMCLWFWGNGCESVGQGAYLLLQINWVTAHLITRCLNFCPNQVKPSLKSVRQGEEWGFDLWGGNDNSSHGCGWAPEEGHTHDVPLAAAHVYCILLIVLGHLPLKQPAMIVYPALPFPAMPIIKRAFCTPPECEAERNNLELLGSNFELISSSDKRQKLMHCILNFLDLRVLPTFIISDVFLLCVSSNNWIIWTIVLSWVKVNKNQRFKAQTYQSLLGNL